jgi:hypothetical protein
MDLKDLKKRADALDNSGNLELFHFLQSRITGMTTPIRAIDEIQELKHKAGLVCPHCDSHSVVQFGKYVIKTRLGRLDGNVIAVNPAVKRLTISRILHFNAPEDLTLGSIH